MPIRIKPIHDLGPCVLDIDSIVGICDLIDQNFSRCIYAADDGFWEVFDAGSREFLDAIKNHKTLDSMRVVAETIFMSGANQGIQVQRSIELIFDRSQARLRLSAPLSDAHWFEHFMIDLGKCVRPPFIRQRLLRIRINEGSDESLSPIMTAVARLSFGLEDLIKYLPSVRYCYILLKRNPPNPFIESIKANLVSNLIWVILVFLAGVVFAIFAYLIFRQFSVNVNDINLLPVIPTSIPKP